MTKPLMNTSVVTYECAIAEDPLRDRLAQEVLASFGLLTDEGKVKPGITFTVNRGDSRKGGYAVRITRDMAKDTTPRIEGPKP
jgi:hypothetical protein